MNIIFVISSPTGGGKTTICNIENSKNNNTRRVITHTTRKPRPNEKDGVDYYFVSKDEFVKSLKNGEFVEYAVVHGNYYGTSKKALLDVTKNGSDALLAIDVQGAKNVMQQFDNVASIFILPPSFDVWIERIKKDNIRDNVDVRLKTALDELDSVYDFNYCIVNDDLTESVRVLESIIEAERNKMKFAKNDRISLINSLKSKTVEYIEGGME